MPSLISFADLVPGHVAHTAALAGTAHALTVMPRTCRSWRAAIAGQQGEALWKAVSLQRFPHLAAILKAAPPPTLPFSEIYQRQLLSETAGSEEAPPLSDYIFSIEVKLLSTGDVVLEWAGSIVAFIDGPRQEESRFQTPALWEPETAPAWVKEAWANDYNEWITVSAYVTQVKTFHTICLGKNMTCDGIKDDGDGPISFFYTHECEEAYTALTYPGDMSFDVDFHTNNGLFEMYACAHDTYNHEEGVFDDFNGDYFLIQLRTWFRNLIAQAHPSQLK